MAAWCRSQSTSLDDRQLLYAGWRNGCLSVTTTLDIRTARARDTASERLLVRPDLVALPHTLACVDVALDQFADCFLRLGL